MTKTNETLAMTKDTDEGITAEEADLVDANTSLPNMTRRCAIKNLAVLSVAFLLLFTAFQSLQNLQSSVNKEAGLGTVSLSVIYVFSMTSGLLAPPLVIRHIGCKWTMVCAIACYITYMAANLHAVWGTMIPASIIIGIGSSPLWVAKCTYLTHISVQYAQLTNASKDGVLSSFFGVFFMCFQTSQIWGNLISSLVFKQAEVNATSEEALEKCGASYCPSDYINNTNLERPAMTKIYTLCGIYLTFACLAALVVLVFLDNLKMDQTSHGSNKTLVSAVARHFYRSRYQKLLIPLTVYSGVEQAYVFGDFTRSFISCSVGVWNVGFIMIAYGVADASFSLIVGRLVKLTSFVPWFILGFVAHASTQITLLLWQPSADAMFVFYLLAVLWGIGDAVMQTLINAYYGYIFTGTPESAFASYRLCESAGFILAFGYSSFLCTSVKTWFCLILLTVGMVLFGVTETLYRRDIKRHRCTSTATENID